MTQEAKIVFDPEDVTGVRLVCTNKDCDCELVRKPSSCAEFPARCPCCNTSWAGGARNEGSSLITAFTRLPTYEKTPVRIRLEMRIESKER